MSYVIRGFEKHLINVCHGLLSQQHNIDAIIIYFAKTFLRANPLLKNLDGKDFLG